MDYWNKESVGEWAVGSGTAINIWNVSWLSRPGRGRVSVQNIDINYTIVADLINQDTATWKTKDLRTLFD